MPRSGLRLRVSIWSVGLLKHIVRRPLCLEWLPAQQCSINDLQVILSFLEVPRNKVPPCLKCKGQNAPSAADLPLARPGLSWHFRQQPQKVGRAAEVAADKQCWMIRHPCSHMMNVELLARLAISRRNALATLLQSGCRPEPPLRKSVSRQPRRSSTLPVAAFRVQGAIWFPKAGVRSPEVLIPQFSPTGEAHRVDVCCQGDYRWRRSWSPL